MTNIPDLGEPQSDPPRMAVELSRPTLRSLLHLAWPIIVARSAQVVVGFSDAIMIAVLGEQELAATTTGAFNSFFFFILPMGTVFIVSSFSAQLIGSGRAREAKRYAYYGLVVAAGFALLIAGAGTQVDSALEWFPFEPRVRELMLTYMSIRLWACFFVVGLEALANYYQGLGNTRLPMLTQLLAMVLNVGLNWVLIFGNLGAPALGVAGAAWASFISTVVAFSALFIAFQTGFRVPEGEKPEDQEQKDHGEGARMRFSWSEFGRMLRFGLPSGMNWFLEFGAFNFFVNVVVAGLGTTALAALNAVMQLNSVSFMPAFGAASAGAILVGQVIGAKRYDYASRAMWLTLLTCCVWQGAVGTACLLMPELFMQAFNLGDEEATELFMSTAVRMLMLSAAWQLFDAIVISVAESLRAAGDTSFSMWARVAVSWLIFAPGSYWTVAKWGGGDVAAVLCLVAYLGILAAVLSLRWATGRWKRIQLI